ncbi:hypothetical protein WH7805_08121 [Synechococcus sp. WH 7805]|nr:hypothetical protein WH7805_08121 [Synechococcus sp. WH 7805]
MGWQPGQHRSPDGTLGRKRPAGATPLKTQITAQLGRTPVFFTHGRTVQDPCGFPQSHHLGMGPQGQIKNGGATVTEAAD